MATLLIYALCTLSDVKETLGISSSDTSQDNLIIRKINQATEMIERYCDRRFALTTYTNEEYDSTRTNQIVLRNRPVTVFTSLSTRDSSQNEDDWQDVETTLYFVDNNSGVLDLNYTFGGSWNRAKATYSAGYSVIPSDLSEACVTLAAFLTQNPTTIAQVKTKEEGSRRIEYYSANGSSSGGSSSVFDMIGIKEILDSYCNYPIFADK